MIDAIERYTRLANNKIRNQGWCIHEDMAKVIDEFLVLYYQVPDPNDAKYEDDLIYGVGIFIVDIATGEFHDVYSIEAIDASLDKIRDQKGYR